MNWLATRDVVVALPRWRFLSLLLRSSVHKCSSFPPTPLLNQQFKHIYCFKDPKVLRGTRKATKKFKELKPSLDDKDLSHMMWWKERTDICKKPSTMHLVKRLAYSNLLGLDVNLKNGSLKEGNLNMEILQFKSKFPREVLLCRVGDFYEAIGVDACILVEYAGLNPIGGLRSDTIPKAGCPVVNLRQTLDDLTRNGFSVCIVEEVQGPAQARSRKGRFIAGHAHPGSPYVFGLVGLDHDLDFPEPMPVVGISRSARGYCIVLVLETMKTYLLEDGLTEEALVTKLRTCRYHHLFLHRSLQQDSSGTCRWGEFGEGGLLWGECRGRHFEWFKGNPVTELLLKVKELYGLDDKVTFRNVTVPSINRPRPLHLGTATQIGAIPTEGIPSLLKVLLPSTCTGLPVLYVRDLILNPPAYEIASTIQATCKLISNVTCSIPDFTCVSSAKLVRLLEQRETNHIEFCRIKSVLDDILQMYKNPELNEILKLLMDPTWVATGLKIDFGTFVNECEQASLRIGEVISLDDESDKQISSYSNIPDDFFEDMESSWKGRVKRIHIEEAFIEVDRAAEALSLAVTEDFFPILSRIRSTTAPLGGPKGEILYARDHESVWFKGKRFVPAIWAGTPGEVQIKQLKPALDSKGKKVGEEWFTTMKVEEALSRYHEAGAKAKSRVLELLRELSAELQTKMNILVFSSMLLVVAKALFCHVSEGRRRKWVFPTLAGSVMSKDAKSLDGASGMKIVSLSPYWFDAAQGSAVHNTVDMQELFLLTGPNGGGKSSLLRSICAAALLGICGFMVPAESALIPQFDAIMLHMKSYDSPADAKSSFQVEMTEIRSIINGTTSRSLVLVDEICRGTETAKGTCIAGSIIETLDNIGCLGIISTHLHGIFSLPLNTKNTVYKAMGTEYVDGQPKPTWKLRDGICRESLAFETAKNEGVPEAVIKRAEDLYLSAYARENHSGQNITNASVNGGSEAHIQLSTNREGLGFDKAESSNRMEGLQQKVERAITLICKMKLVELCNQNNISGHAELLCVSVAAREQPPPSTIGASCVYVMFIADEKIYVGQTDDLAGRIRTHRARKGMQSASFIYFTVPGKSIACELETLLINQLSDQGFRLTNVADGTCRWGEFGEGGLLWGECRGRHFEWFKGNPVTELLLKVKELYGLDDKVTFRNVTVPSINRPRPLHLGTATQIGAIPTEGIPSLLKVLLPSTCTGLPVLYVRDLILNPPAYEIASTIQATCKLISNVTCSIPDFTCVSSAKLVRLLEQRETNHIEFCRIKSVLDDILQMYKNPELNEILKLLMDPTWVATGLKIDFGTFVNECEQASLRIGEVISLDDESDKQISSYSNIPDDFFEDMESSWKGRVKRIHIEEAFIEVDRAAEALSLAVTEDFFPILSRIRSTTAPLGGPKGEILYARDHESVWFKGKRFVPAIWAGTPGEVQIKQLKPALDSKGKKVGEEWFTTMKVEEALSRYHEAGAKAKSRVLELLRELSAELQTKMNILVFSSMLLVVAKALFCHVSEGRRRKWVFPTLAGSVMSKDAKSLDGASGMKIVSLSPYWFDAAQGSAVHNTVDMQELFLLTGPNGGGKSSLLRSICAAALLGICGFMVPAESALIPQFDAIMLHMKSYDSPADAKSSFQVEMTEIRSIINGTTSRSLVLVDEICRGTETAKGTCIAGSIIETLDNIGCLGIISTHLHGIFSLPLNTKNTVYKAMGTEYVDGQPKPTWKLRDGICRESLAFETAKNEGVPEAVIKRAEDLYLSAYARENHSGQNITNASVNGGSEAHIQLSTNREGLGFDKAESSNRMEGLQQKVERAITLICKMKLVELCNQNNISGHAELLCVSVAAREQPPPSTIGASCVYVMFIADEKIYVGQTDDLAGRIRTHRARKGMQSASFIYFTVPGKSIACELETLLINQLSDQGFRLTNVADGMHRNFGTNNLPTENVFVK